jgi:hypothetical protein
MIFVVSEFVSYVHEYEKATRYSEGKTHNVDERINLAPFQVPEKEFKAIFKQFYLPFYPTE